MMCVKAMDLIEVMCVKGRAHCFVGGGVLEFKVKEFAL